jgi:hypothetical protein
MSKLRYRQIVEHAQEECSRAKRCRIDVDDSQSYEMRIKNFIFFMHSHKRPGASTLEDFLGYRVVIEAMVERGEFEQSALDVF